MKVRAIRVAEFRRFREPVALEGLTGGLDLVLGPNEAGKSTLFRALCAALFEKHRSTRAELAEIRPYGGGAPLVEVEFEALGERWRVRKRFLSERSAELVSLSTGAVSRGSDAEDALERLLDQKGAPGRFPMLWLKQGALLETPHLDEKGAAVLRTAIDREVASAAGGGAARRVRKSVLEALDELVTAKRGQKKGRYQEAARTMERVAAELAQARSAYANAEALLDRLGALDAALEELVRPEVQSALQRRLTDAEERLKAAQQEVTARDAARVALADARTAHQAASAAEKALNDALAEIERLEASARHDAAEKAELTTRLATVEAEYAAAIATEASCRNELDLAERRLKRATAIARWRELSEREARARAAAARIEELQARLEGLPRDGARVRQARILSARVAEGAARLEAASAAVTVHYEPGSGVRISADGRAIADGARLVATAPVVLEVPGVGRIEIDPGASSDRERIEAELNADRAALGDILRAMQAVDLPTLEAKYDKARAIASELEAARAEAAGIAPEGAAVLEDQLKAIADEIGGSPGAEEGSEDPSALAGEVGRLRARVLASEEACRALGVGREALRQKSAALATRAEERERRRSEIAAALPPAETRSQRRAEVAAAAAEANRALDDALRMHTVAVTRAPDREGLARLEHEVAEARQALRRSEQEAAALGAERARIEGALAAARHEDLETRVARLSVEAERAQAVLADIEEEVQALQLLERELAEADDRLRETYLAPVLDRLAPYVDMVFPNAGLTFGAGYAVEALQRGCRAEALDHLSEGTREQIAVLVRLAFGRLLADQGMQVPLVLDDALVYSDDQRIAAMHRALEAAAQSHQVIVLSCREQSFAGLRGNRVALVPWQPERN